MKPNLLFKKSIREVKRKKGKILNKIKHANFEAKKNLQVKLRKINRMKDHQRHIDDKENFNGWIIKPDKSSEFSFGANASPKQVLQPTNSNTEQNKSSNSSMIDNITNPLLKKKESTDKALEENDKNIYKDIPRSKLKKEDPKDSKFFKSTFNKKFFKQNSLNGIFPEIYKYLRRIESFYTIESNLLNDNTKFKENRKVLVDWMIRISHEMRLLRESLYLGVSVFDRFIMIYSEAQENKLNTSFELDYELIALASLYTGCKYEELKFPTVNDFIMISKYKYSQEEFFRAESEILRTLGWRMNYYHPMNFFDYFTIGFEIEKEAYHFAQFMLEVLLFTGANQKFKNSIIGAGLMYLVLKIFKRRSWDLKLTQKTFYTKREVVKAGEEFYRILETFWKTENKKNAVLEKYSEIFYSKIGKMRISTRLRD